MVSHEEKLPVIILAAGRGIRLGPLTESLPKCMLPVGNDTIIQRQIRAIEHLGLANEVYVVCGYKYDKLIGHLDMVEAGGRNIGYANRTIALRYILNPIWDRTNNIYSLYMAEKYAKNGFYLFNGDVVFDFEILERFAKTDGTAMVIDNVKTLGEEEMKVVIREGAVREISKEIEPSRASGEYIGILRFNAEDARILFQEIREFIDRGETGVWYENAIQEIIGAIHIRPSYTRGSRWIEVDTKEDYDLMKRMSLEE